MTDSKSIAQLVGPTLMVMAPSEALNLHIWERNIAAVTYLNGTLLFLAGLAIVRVHNRWRRGWPVLVTLVGWVAMAGGLFRMYVPEARQGGQNLPTIAVIMLVFLAGCFLTFSGYRRDAP